MLKKKNPTTYSFQCYRGLAMSYQLRVVSYQIWKFCESVRKTQQINCVMVYNQYKGYRQISAGEGIYCLIYSFNLDCIFLGYFIRVFCIT